MSGGQQITSGQGTLGTLGGPGATLSGSASTGAAGTVPPGTVLPLRSRKVGAGSASRPLTTSLTTVAQGAGIANPIIATIGSPMNLSLGTARAAKNIPLSGALVSTSQGSITTAGDPTWFQNVPAIQFTSGIAQNIDLRLLYTSNYDTANYDIVFASGSPALPSQVTLSAEGVLSYSGVSTTFGPTTGYVCQIIDQPGGNVSRPLVGIASTPQSGTLLVASDAQADWNSRSQAAGVMHAQNFLSFNTATEMYNAYYVGAMVGRMAGKNPGQGTRFTNAFEIVTTTGHSRSGKAFRLWQGKNDYGSPGSIDNQWWGIPLNGDGNNIAGAFKTHVFVQVTVWMDGMINYAWQLPDTGAGTHKVFGVDQYTGISFLNRGETVIDNQVHRGFVSGYYTRATNVSDPWETPRVSPGNNNNFATQPAIDTGSTLDGSLASYLRRYGPHVYDMYPGGIQNQALTLAAQGVPNPDAAIGGVAWNRGGMTTVELELDYDNHRYRVWAARTGIAPKLIYDSGLGVAYSDYNMTFPDGNGWSAFWFTNLINKATGADNPNYPADAYIDYSELIISTNPINFPGGYTVP